MTAHMCPDHAKSPENHHENHISLGQRANTAMLVVAINADVVDAGDDHARRSFDEGRHWLSAVGLSSIPCWYEHTPLVADQLKSYALLISQLVWYKLTSRICSRYWAAAAASGACLITFSPLVRLIEQH